MRQLFVDLDGVLADFDTHVETLLGFRPNRNEKEPADFWDRIKAQPNFFGTMPVLPDAYDLWFGLRELHPNPIILTGCPREMPEAATQKREWVRRYFGLVNVITCQSKNKRDYSKPGDVLVDDWAKYQQLWIDAGGVFIYHNFGFRNTLTSTREYFK